MSHRLLATNISYEVGRYLMHGFSAKMQNLNLKIRILQHLSLVSAPTLSLANFTKHLFITQNSNINNFLSGMQNSPIKIILGFVQISAERKTHQNAPQDAPNHTHAHSVLTAIF